MSVAYAYFRYITDKEKHKSLVYYYSGPSDVPLIVSKPARFWDDMENTDTEKAVAEVNTSKDEGQSSAATKRDENTSFRMLSALHQKPKNGGVCLRVLYGLLCFFAAAISIALIIVAILTSVATKAYDAEQSSRLVGMVMLAVTAAVTVSVSVYGVVAVIKNHSKPIHTTGIVLVVVIVIQAIICGVSINVSPTDELNLEKSLADSFKMSRESNQRHVKLWAVTQSDLTCCGLYGPQDYRPNNMLPYFPPNIPITCCPTYDQDRSELVQEREREFCRARKSYYDIGCKNLVINVFKETAAVVLTVAITLIIFEVFLVFLSCCLGKKMKKHKENEIQEKK